MKWWNMKSVNEESGNKGKRNNEREGKQRRKGLRGINTKKNRKRWDGE